MIQRTIDRVFLASAGVLLGLFLTACASTAPPELREARSSYSDVAHGQTVEYAPAEVQNARIALERAEQSFNEDGDSDETIAKAQFAIQEANRARDVAERRKSNQEEMAKMLEAERPRQIDAGAYQTESTPAQLEAEESDTFATALKALEGVVDVEEQQLGVVITLPAGAFASGSAKVGPTAEPKLRKIADALGQAGNRLITIEGYTDSTGDADFNRTLSQQRAEAVLNWLAGHDIQRNQMNAVGRGSSDPIASNDDAEGRAKNRRVQIIVGEPGVMLPTSPDMAAPGPEEDNERNKRERDENERNPNRPSPFE